MAASEPTSRFLAPTTTSSGNSQTPVVPQETAAAPAPVVYSFDAEFGGRRACIQGSFSDFAAMKNAIKAGFDYPSNKDIYVIFNGRSIEALPNLQQVLSASPILVVPRKQ